MAITALGSPRIATKARPNQSGPMWLLLVLATGSVLRVPQLFHSLNEAYGFRQTQTAMVIREYARSSIDLRQTPLPIFGAGADVPFELPLFQALAAMVARLGLDASVAGRLLALVSFQVAIGAIALLLSRWRSWRVALTFAVLSEGLAFGLAWGAANLIDGFAVALAALAVLSFDLFWSRWKRRWAVLGSIALWLGLLVKPTTMIPWCLLILVSALVALKATQWRSVGHRYLIALLAGPGLGLLWLGAWTSYSDSVKRGSVYTEWMTSTSLAPWTLGTLQQRLTPDAYLVLATRLLGILPLVIGIGLVALACLPSARGQREHAWGFLAVMLAGPLVFFNLYLIHEYYLLAVYPAAVALLAIGLVRFSDEILGKSVSPRLGLPAMVVVALALSAAGGPGARDLSQFIVDEPYPQLARDVGRMTMPHEELLVAGCDWDPTLLYAADRKGLMIRNPESAFLPSIEQLARIDKVASCVPDPSPYLPPGYAAQPTPVPNIYLLRPHK